MMKALAYHGPGRKAREDAADPDVMASRPIVVGVDGSEQAPQAVEWATREAVWRKAPLRIISVSAMPSRMRPYSATPATVADTLRKMSARALAAALARAQEVGADLVAIGRHGGPHRARLGSIQHPLLSHAHGAIAVVPSLI
jgi:nucleotide-binding universal stress UspA family protein